MRRILFVGQTGAGKTTLTQALHGEGLSYLKTQAVRFRGFVVDTPGEFAENRMYYSALLVSANKAEVVGLLQDATRKHNIFPPRFAAMFSKPVIGIITKIDQEHADLARAEKFLKAAGVKTIFHTSAVANTGLEALLEFLDQ